MGRTTKHAIVIGASIGGLCAARVLSDFYERVTVYERDELPDGPANRSAVPQGRHVHLLMARGAQEFEEHFPGLLDEMVAAGVPILENRPDCIHFGAAGHVLGTHHRLQTEFTAYVPSRPQSGMADPAARDRDRQRRRGARRGQRASIRRRPAAGDRRGARFR